MTHEEAVGCGCVSGQVGDMVGRDGWVEVDAPIAVLRHESFEIGGAATPVFDSSDRGEVGRPTFVRGITAARGVPAKVGRRHLPGRRGRMLFAIAWLRWPPGPSNLAASAAKA